MADRELNGTTALVTGGGTRVGAAIARRLAMAGCDLVVHYGSNASGADEVVRDAQRAGRRAVALQADLYDRTALADLAQKTAEFSAGALGVLVHNAANFDRVTPDALTAEHWDRALALNATAPYLLTLALAPALRNARGAVVAIADVAAERPWVNYLPYSVSKAALVQLVRGMALALAPAVRVNAVAPGTVLPPEEYSAEKLARIAAQVPLERLGTPDDVAAAVEFLARSDFITGQLLAVDGGRLLR